MSKRLCYEDGTAFKCATDEELQWIQRKLISEGYEWLGGGTAIRSWDDIETEEIEKLDYVSIVISQAQLLMVYDLSDVTVYQPRWIKIERVYDVKEYMNER